MDRTIQEGVKRVHQEAYALQRILFEYPDAVERPLPDGTIVWSSERIVPTEVALCEALYRGESRTWFCPYIGIPTGADHWSLRLYTGPNQWMQVGVALMYLQKNEPAAYAALLQTIRST